MGRIANLFAGLLTGAVFGAAVALLLTPSSGKQVRSNITGYVEQVEREVRLAAKEKRSELENQLAALRGEIVTE
ncbi:MAG: YtxH domain-containing protein [Anaerolineaceae bacterium]|nr:YtxH domain-containing protein [Anaerolineaceae bacterium]